MSLRDILTKIHQENQQILLNDGEKDWEAKALLDHLSEPMLKRSAHMQAGMYIAEINDGGYLGRVMFKIRAK